MPGPAEASDWTISYDTQQCQYSFFLSHVQEDLPQVKELRRQIHKKLPAIERDGASRRKCFLDSEDWPAGQPNVDVIRRTLRLSQVFVAYVTPQYLRGTRGWTWLELAYAQLIEDYLNVAMVDRRFPFVLVVFRDVTIEDVHRTPLWDLWSRAAVGAHESLSPIHIATRLVGIREIMLGDRGLT